MYQVIQYQNSGEIFVEELPVPECMPNGILVRNEYSLISAGTEKTSVSNAKSNLLARAKKQPEEVKTVIKFIKKEGIISTAKRVFSTLDSFKTLGYSTSGVVVESQCDEFRIGDRVACAGAGYANHSEYVSIPKNLAVKIPDSVSFESASYTTVAAIAMQGIRQADLRLGETVAVIGLGLIGQITVQLLKASGCRVIGMDTNESLFSLAKQFGCDLTLSSKFSSKEQILAFTNGMGCDAVLITAGTKSNEPLEIALDITRKKGRVVIVGAIGMNVPRPPFYLKEIDLKISCSYGPGRYDYNYEENGNDYPFAYVRWTENRNMQAIIDLLSQKKLDFESITTHRFDVKDAAKAYDIIIGKTQENYNGIVLKYPFREQNHLVIQNKNYKNQAQNNINIGFIGVGTFAKNYLIPPLQNMKANFISVATQSAVNSKTISSRYNFKEFTTNGSEVINNKEVNTCFIATRHNSHAKFVIEAIKKNKPVFVEKPLAINQLELDEIIQAINEFQGKIMVGFNRRFSKSFTSIKEFFKNRTEPFNINYRVNAGFIPKNHWIQAEDQGGRIIGEACHFIDTMAYLTGALPVRVYAESISTNNLEQTNYDNVAINIKFSDGSLGVLQYLANGDSSLPKEYCEVFCEKSVAIMNNFEMVEFIKSGKSRKVKMDGGKGINEEVTQTIQSIKDGKEMPISLIELLKVTETTFAALESLKTGLPVTLK